MNLASKRTGLILLGSTAVVFSRMVFWFFDDPEGPNLLVVFVLASILYSVSLLAFVSKIKLSDHTRVMLAVSIQAMAAFGIYFLL